MSGIGGLIRLDGRPVEPAELDGLRQRLAWRGPDAAGIWHAGPAGLVHALFRTTPESLSEQQPLASEDGRLVITADARLDNRAELCAALGRRDEGQPDAALILAAYARWGEACAERLLGDFAFAIWEAAERRLFCARDALGVRPFFYHHGPGLFVFGSTLEAVARQPGVPRAVNEARTATYLAGGVDYVQTFYRDILRLPAAHSVTVEAGGARLCRYWDIHAPRETRLPSDAAYAEALRERLDEAVGAALRSATPVGVMLSGGLDSSAVTGLARRRLPAERLHTFSLLFDAAAASDEREYVQAVAAAGGVTHHDLPGDEASLVTRVEAFLAAYGEPYYHLALALPARINDAARASGAGVVLSGDFGDAAVGHGYTLAAELVRAGRWPRAAREVRLVARGQGLHGRPLYNYVWSVLLAQAPDSARHAWRVWRNRRRREQPGWAAGTIINRDFARRVSAEHGLRDWLGNRPPFLHSTAEDSRFYLGRATQQAELFNQLAALTGVEARHPFLHRRLAEFCLGLPGDQRLRDGWPRHIHRRALEGLVPEAVRWRRSKMNPIQSVSRALLERDRPELDRLLEAARAAGDWLDLSQLARDRAQLDAAAARGEHEHARHWPAQGRVARALHTGLWLKQAGFI
jgi:asparagine synthase (glutamine-hydrolysing)